MTIENHTTLKRSPVHLGEVLRKDFMPDYDLTVSGGANVVSLSVSSTRQTLYA